MDYCFERVRKRGGSKRLKELRVFRLKTFGFHLREASPIHHDPTQPSYDNTGLVGSECTFSIKRSFLPPQSTLSTDHPRSRTRSLNHPPPRTIPSSPDETTCQPDRDSGSEARPCLGLGTGAARPGLRFALHDCAEGSSTNITKATTRKEPEK